MMAATIQHVILVRHNGRDLKHITENGSGDDYPWRWDQAASLLSGCTYRRQSYQRIRSDMAAGGGADSR